MNFGNIYKFIVATSCGVSDSTLQDVKPNTLMNAGGEFSGNNNYYTSGKMMINTGCDIAVRIGDFLNNEEFYICSFDSAGGFINGAKLGTERDFAISKKASFIRVCVLTSEADNIQVSIGRVCNPIYSSSLTKDTEKDSDGWYFRDSLSGNLDFVREDYDFINQYPFETEFKIYIRGSRDNGKTWKDFLTGHFFPTNLTVNVDDRLIRVKPEVLDDYTKVLEGIENEYDLVKLAPKITPMVYYLRPIIQIYVPGDNILTNFLSGMRWEQDVLEATDSEDELRSKYYFYPMSRLVSIQVTTNSEGIAQDYVGLYAGKVISQNLPGYSRYETGTFYDADRKRKIVYQGVTQSGTGTYVSFYAYSSDEQENADFYTIAGTRYIEDVDMINLYDRFNTGSYITLSIVYIPIYGRYLLDLPEFKGEETYPLPSDDIVEHNTNYRYVVGYDIDVADVSIRTSEEPTEYGLAKDGNYFMTPYDPNNRRYYPIGQSQWIYGSYWFAFWLFDFIAEKAGRCAYQLRDTFELASVINVLLKQIAPEIKHEATYEYSQFLYGDINPISNERAFKLLISQKTNLKNGKYTKPAQKAPVTLKQITDMLANVYKCYWYIEDKKFKIEHIDYFRRGKTYNNSNIIGLDLNYYINRRNGKSWAFGQNEYSYDKTDIAKRYEFGWMDDVSENFAGQPIEIISQYATDDKVEEITIDNFTSDIDYVLTTPEDVSDDGFMLFATMPGRAIDTSGRYPSYYTTSGTDGITSPVVPIVQGFSTGKGKLRIEASGGGNGPVVFYDGEMKELARTGNIYANGTDTIVDVIIPDGATCLAILASGQVTAHVYAMDVNNIMQAPFVQVEGTGADIYQLQNGYAAFEYIHPTFWIYDMPAKKLKVNGVQINARNVQRYKNNSVKFPDNGENINLYHLIKTGIGNGQISKISLNLSSRIIEADLNYDTEQ